MTKAVFLDRDGVLNQAIVKNGKPHPPAQVENTVILPGTLTALQTLSQAGYLLIVITNQPDVARGITTRTIVEDINHYLSTQLPIDAMYTCFHDNLDYCTCRKPQPGSLLKAAAEYRIDLQQSYMIGDRWTDMEAGQRAGCKTIFIDYGYAEQQPPLFHARVKTLMEATQFILGENHEKH